MIKRNTCICNAFHRDINRGSKIIIILLQLRFTNFCFAVNVPSFANRYAASFSSFPPPLTPFKKQTKAKGKRVFAGSVGEAAVILG